MNLQDVTGEDFALDRRLLSPISHIVPPPSLCDTFEWDVQPEDGVVRGTIYTDGSQFHGPTPLLRLCGWAFVALNDQGMVFASASGLPRFFGEYDRGSRGLGVTRGVRQGRTTVGIPSRLLTMH